MRPIRICLCFCISNDKLLLILEAHFYYIFSPIAFSTVKDLNLVEKIADIKADIKKWKSMEKQDVKKIAKNLDEITDTLRDLKEGQETLKKGQKGLFQGQEDINKRLDALKERAKCCVAWNDSRRTCMSLILRLLPLNTIAHL